MTIDRPRKVNALTRDMRATICRGVAEVMSLASARTIILTGTGGNFSSGADLLDGQGAGSLLEGEALRDPLWDTLRSCPLPIVAAVEGYALGAGFELALHSDFVIASTDAQFGFPEIHRGIIPGAGGCTLLCEAIGQRRALELLVSGDRLNGMRAYELGLVYSVCEPGHALDTAQALASKIADRAPLCTTALKTLARQIRGLTRDDAFRIELEAFQRLFQSNDAREGFEAFAQKRLPKFDGN